MKPHLSCSRVLIYSHDSYGLGHLRRCRAIARSLADRYAHASFLILTGSPAAGSFGYGDRVRVAPVAGITKRLDGEYAALDGSLGVSVALASRAASIRRAVETFEPDVFIVDKEPTGLRGEVLDALELARSRGVRLVLGLRDVMDEPERLLAEWERKEALPALRELYDDIWIYGLPQVFEPLQGIPLPPSVRRKISYTGYLRRDAEFRGAVPNLPGIVDRPYLLVTTGGGGDGADLVDWVLRAYEQDPLLPYPALVVLGPFMPAERQAEFLARASRLKRVAAIEFHAGLETLMARASGVVAMGGYNTFCEMLSFDKRALIVPRTEPRLEQFIRASRAATLGLAGVLADDGCRDPAAMAAALRRMPGQRLPSEIAIPGLLDGLESVGRLVAPWIRSGTAPLPVPERLQRRA